MQRKSIGNELGAKKKSFEDVFQTIAPMIHHIATQVDGVYGLEVEDIEQELSIKAYNTWEKWEPRRGTKFSTYMYNVLVNKKNGLIRIAKAKKHNCGLSPASLDESIESQDSGTGILRLYDAFASINQDLEEWAQALEIWDVAEQTLASMQEKEQTVIRALLSGYTQMEISRLTGMRQPLISYYMKNFRAKVKVELERREIR